MLQCIVSLGVVGVPVSQGLIKINLPWGERKCGSVQVRDESVPKTVELPWAVLFAR